MTQSNHDSANQMTKTSTRSKSRRGAAMVELAFVLPILLVTILGIIDLGRVLMLNQVTTHASREALRRAIVPGMTQAQVLSTANFYLDSGGVSSTGREVLILDGEGNATTGENIQSHELLVVQISIPYDQNIWASGSIMGSNTLVRRSEMRRE